MPRKSAHHNVGLPADMPVQDLFQCVGQVDRRIDLVTIDRDALHVDAERDAGFVCALEDALQVRPADLDRLGERIRRPEN